ncbi:hypothetical protein SISSUDRAFT_1063276 [Sistotremastrum suecicum HHB10207 ss-3]|uniref:Secreted protein n=1 Tax=Sistotremastrum suecicum HHB10207 ss-3 TaxID=1314776 RepID=A0A166BZA8_9AGAM|nr:hypothetical protein SISSUDRAFT_1063276 [Sistotremastrum suecicum HHB10207 ss-3]
MAISLSMSLCRCCLAQCRSKPPQILVFGFFCPPGLATVRMFLYSLYRSLVDTTLRAFVLSLFGILWRESANRYGGWKLWLINIFYADIGRREGASR